MEHPGPILDYASPRSRVQRLPSQSIISLHRTVDTCVITETLSGQGAAIGALIFSAFVLAVMISIAVTAPPMKDSGIFGFATVTGSIIVTLSLLVIRNTWRKTVLSIAEGELSITFSAPFTRPRRMAWPAMEITNVELMTTNETAWLGEMRIYPHASPTVHLFTDHGLTELSHVTTAVQAALAVRPG